MSEQFYTLVTLIGQAKIANANVLGNKVNFVKLKVGDGGGSYYNPTENQTDIKNKVWEGNINSIYVHETNKNWIVIETIIPGDVGGFTIRESGIYDDENNLIAISKYPETYKPLPSDGSAKDLMLKIILEVSNSSNVTLKIDPTVIVATKTDIKTLEIKINNSSNEFNTHLTDSRFQLAGGTGTAITLTLSSLVNGYSKTFIASANNGGAATTINGKKFYKPGTTISPNLIAGKAYTVWYNSSGDCFFIKASAEGNTIASHVLAGDIFSTEIDTGSIGTMPNKGAVVITPSVINQPIPLGYHENGYVIGDSNLISDNIKANKSIFGIQGKPSVVETSDANALAAQIVEGYISYTNGNKIIGTANIQSLGGLRYQRIEYLPSDIIIQDSGNGIEGTALKKTLPISFTPKFMIVNIQKIQVFINFVEHTIFANMYDDHTETKATLNATNNTYVYSASTASRYFEYSDYGKRIDIWASSITGPLTPCYADIIY
ncbi:hypothetical protein CLPUN_08190 [Clostridium puniceum]|uniref:Phage tail fibre protein N-terminal domain-containing protein n=1 Tax=Clostridium puniceum TaxID=29367 RepID=A0A1S8TWQ6_9CLOT|nr:phage tail protein [Clostridium puniceum]OOM81825.1 hypothetical protein CLPUN_08190 [Clostridium puniceum]